MLQGPQRSQEPATRTSPPPAPVRDASSLKAVRYGPGHEKFPSWPGEATPRSNITGGSTRSKSWTEHTNYPKEQPPIVSRPYNKRPNPAFTQQASFMDIGEYLF